MIFILDNFDSFTYNLYQYFGEIGEEVIVRRRDQCSIQEIEGLAPELIVISPGPCAPRDAELTLAVIDYFKGKIPLLGVCLGHQAIGEIFGAEVVRAQAPVHGKVSAIQHDGQGVFYNLPNPLTVTRYHSLALHRHSIPEELVITAVTAEGEIMGIRHRNYPIEGVQFHPEAILTEEGHSLLRNAIEQAREWNREQQNNGKALNKSPWIVRDLDISMPPIGLIEGLRECSFPFLLDSGEGYGKLGRYSFLGAFPYLQATAYPTFVELVWPEMCKRETLYLKNQTSISVLDDLFARFKQNNPTSFPFVGGAVGFLSYDLKNELEKLPQTAIDDLGIPLWRFSWYDGILIYDHEQSGYHAVACGMNEMGKCHETLALSRIERLEGLIKKFVSNRNPSEPLRSQEKEHVPKETLHQFTTRDQYLFDLQKVIDYIYAGDIYQANLTQRFSLPYEKDGLALYQLLHAQNPAPFAAYLPYEDFEILSSSPERFIRIDPDGTIETCPIKGTRPRGRDEIEDRELAEQLLNSIKDRAELTMIIDLERNDLGRICKLGSVRVTDLIRLEKYPTVWHLVSTIMGTLQSNLKLSEILKAIFPGGSITGAPKIRAMEVIDELERYQRGIYTGSIGYIGFDGSWDLNIVIRTLLLKDGQAYFHAGGGIVADSSPEAEYEETLHKIRALVRALGGQIQ